MNEEQFSEQLKKFKDLSSAFFPTGIVLSAIDLGVFTGLEAGPSEAANLALKLNVDARSLSVMLQGLAGIGYLERNGNTYSNTPFSSRALVKGKPGYEGDSALMSLWFMRLMGGLADVVKTGHAQETFEEAVTTSPVKAAVLVRAMDQISRAFVDGLREHLDMTGVKKVLDAGGAAGSFAMALIKDHPGATGTVFELPHACDEAEKVIAENNLSDRMSVHRGDFRVDEFGDGWDIIFFSNIFHLLDPDSSAAMVNKAAAALSPGGRLVVKDMIGDPTAVLPTGLTVYSILMLLISRGGALHSLDAYSAWCRAAGLEAPERIDVWERSSLIIARKPA